MTDITHDDDAFHEIQLSGKQLVFLFMATTVISVVIFLCGVLVGRGVRAEEIGAADAFTSASSDPTAEPPAPESLAADTSAPPAEAVTTYADRLEGEKGTERLKRPEEDSAPADVPAARVEAPAPVAEVPAPVAESKQAEPRTAPAATVPPPVASAASQGARRGIWAVQVMSLRDRAGASQLVQRLNNKGYPAFIVAPTPDTPTRLYKVQVGRYGDRSEADQVATRLKKEEQFDTWIVR